MTLCHPRNEHAPCRPANYGTYSTIFDLHTPSKFFITTPIHLFFTDTTTPMKNVFLWWKLSCSKIFSYFRIQFVKTEESKCCGTAANKARNKWWNKTTIGLMPLYLPATGLHLAAPSPSRSESDSRLTNRHERGKGEREKPSSGGGISQSSYNKKKLSVVTTGRKQHNTDWI